MARMTTCLWFTDQAEEAANFYVNLFDDASLGEVTRYPADGQEAGSVMTASFQLRDMSFMALNGGDAGFKFNESVSFIIYAETQEEIDHYWDGLTADGGAPGQCGWLKDKYGLSWQVAPHILD